METQTFEGVAWYDRFIRCEGDYIEIISTNVLLNGNILVTYKHKGG